MSELIKMSNLKKLFVEEVDVILSRYNCCVGILNGMSISEAKKEYGVYEPAKTLKRWCKSSNHDGYNGLLKHDVVTLRANKHLFIGECD